MVFKANNSVIGADAKGYLLNPGDLLTKQVAEEMTCHQTLLRNDANWRACPNLHRNFKIN